MEKSHTVHYDGHAFEVFGEYDEPESETGYKGGFSWRLIKLNDKEIGSMLNDYTIDMILTQLVEENY